MSQGSVPDFHLQVVGVADDGKVVIETNEGKCTQWKTVRKAVALEDIRGTTPMSLNAVRAELAPT